MSKSVSTNVFKKKTGIQNVREYLEAGRSITPLEALGNWGIFRLASTVEQLRKQGVNVVTKMKNDPNGKTYAEYVLGEAKKELKVGARVRVKEGVTDRFYLGGDEGVVIAMDQHALVKFHTGLGASNGHGLSEWYTNHCELELI